MPALFFVELSVTDWPGQVRWYVDVLGLALELRDERRGFALLKGGDGSCIALKSEPDRKVQGVRLAFLVESVGAERDRLARLGVEVSEVREEAAEGYREVRLRDPEGTPITLFCWG